MAKVAKAIPLHLAATVLVLLLGLVARGNAFSSIRHRPSSTRVLKLNRDCSHCDFFVARGGVATSPKSITRTTHERHWALRSNQGDDSAEELVNEAERLLSKARAIRASLPQNENESNRSEVSPIDNDSEASPDCSSGYRLYLDIGREPGTWMDPRWGGSGRRIEFSVDCAFAIPGRNSLKGVSDMGGQECPSPFASKEVAELMVKDNFGGKSSPVYTVESSEFARLRGGFDKMRVQGGAYRIDENTSKSVRSQSSTLRFYLLVDGTEGNKSFGDVSVPKGCLFFSIPCFGAGPQNISTKEGPVTVRQMGWKTGWYREESRIVGVFRCVPIEKARKRDKY